MFGTVCNPITHYCEKPLVKAGPGGKAGQIDPHKVESFNAISKKDKGLTVPVKNSLGH